MVCLKVPTGYYIYINDTIMLKAVYPSLKKILHMQFLKSNKLEIYGIGIWYSLSLEKHKINWQTQRQCHQ